MTYSNKYKITYLERPVTIDEKSLASLLEIVISALHENDFEKLEAVFSPRASIVLSSADKNPIDVTECMARLTKFAGSIRRINYEDALIRVNGSQALISATRSVYLKGEMPHVAPRYLKCKKENNKWEIIEANFI